VNDINFNTPRVVKQIILSLGIKQIKF